MLWGFVVHIFEVINWTSTWRCWRNPR